MSKGIPLGPVSDRARSTPSALVTGAGPVAQPALEHAALAKPPSLVGRALMAVLLTIGFYGLALAIVAALLFVVYAEVQWANRVNTRLTIACVVAAGTILWSILPRLDRFEAPGPALQPAEHPRLFGEIEGVALATGQAMPKEVYLVANVNAGVMERGGVLGIGSRRVMILGLPLMQMLTAPQLRGVLAHEFGHFCGGDTRLGPWVYKTRAAIGRTIQNLGRSWLQAPFRWYGLMFLRITHAISRRQEFVADELAARTVGAQAFGVGLRTIAAALPAFHGYMGDEYLPALSAGFRPPLVEGFARFVSAEPVSQAMQHVVQREAESQQTDPYDTHPTLGERLAAVQALPTGPQLSDDRPALSLLENVPALEDALVMHLLGQERTEALRPVAWDDIGATVYLPKWQEVARRYTAGLAGVTPTTLPTYLRSPDPLVKAIEQAAGRTLLQQETTGAVRNILGAALAAALARQGWAADASPGVPVTLRRGDRVIVSFIAVHALADGKLSPQEWQQQCQEAGIADLSLAIE